MTTKQEPPQSKCDYNFFYGSGTGNNFLIVYLKKDERYSSALKDVLIYKINNDSVDSGLIFKHVGDDIYLMFVIEKDGSESAFCGNGARVFAHYLYETEKIEKAKLFSINGTVNFGKNENGFFVECGTPTIFISDINIVKNYLFKRKKYLFRLYEVHGEPHLITNDFFDANELILISKKVSDVNVSCIERDKIITYERGVNNITQSCGSACVAATQYILDNGFNKDIAEWRCLGGINYVDTKTFSLTGSTTLYL
jgi:diaminopimelate epimerase